MFDNGSLSNDNDNFQHYFSPKANINPGACTHMYTCIDIYVYTHTLIHIYMCACVRLYIYIYRNAECH